MRAFSSASACRTALATARMTTSRPTAASATAVNAGGMLISRRFGSTMRRGKSTVSRCVRNACKPEHHPSCQLDTRQIMHKTDDLQSRTNLIPDKQCTKQMTCSHLPLLKCEQCWSILGQWLQHRGFLMKPTSCRDCKDCGLKAMTCR